MKIEVARIGKRASRGKDWDVKAANDNTSPAIKWLLAGQRKEMLEPLLTYIRLDREANSGAMLTGEAHSPADLLQIDQATWIDPATGGRSDTKASAVFLGLISPVGSTQVNPRQTRCRRRRHPRLSRRHGTTIARLLRR